MVQSLTWELRRVTRQLRLEARGLCTYTSKVEDRLWPATSARLRARMGETTSEQFATCNSLRLSTSFTNSLFWQQWHSWDAELYCSV